MDVIDQDRHLEAAFPCPGLDGGDLLLVAVDEEDALAGSFRVAAAGLVERRSDHVLDALECVHAIIQAPADLDLDEIRRHLDEQLARYKHPRSYEIATAPLRDDAGKVRRSQLRADRINARSDPDRREGR